MQMIIPPWLGRAGSVAFFAILFATAHKDAEGYAEFRKCHSHCGNGILHFVGMPLAVAGVFAIVRSVVSDVTEYNSKSNHNNNSGLQFTRLLQALVVTGYLYYYLQFSSSSSSLDTISNRHRYTPWIFYTFYMIFLEGALRKMHNLNNNRLPLFCMGVALIALNVGFLEVVGHGLLEHHHSYIEEFFNSVFHTPLYGINTIFLSLEEHHCWW